MVVKIAGLATGALVASVAVWAFNDWRHVSDDDRFAALLSGCLDFVINGENAFSDQGRSLGVYDVPEFSGPTDAQSQRLLYDGRIEVAVQTLGTFNIPTRFCSVAVVSNSANLPLMLQNEGWTDAVSNTIADYRTVELRITELTATGLQYDWREPDMSPDDSLIVTMFGEAQSVSAMLFSAAIKD